MAIKPNRARPQYYGALLGIGGWPACHGEAALEYCVVFVRDQGQRWIRAGRLYDHQMQKTRQRELQNGSIVIDSAVISGHPHPFAGQWPIDYCRGDEGVGKPFEMAISLNGNWFKGDASLTVSEKGVQHLTIAIARAEFKPGVGARGGR